MRKINNLFLIACLMMFSSQAYAQITEFKLTASDAAASDNFGRSVSISGDYAIVGASYDDKGRGSAYIFVRDGQSWTEQAKLTESGTFGYSVSISGDYAIVGDDIDLNGITWTYIFVRDGQSWTKKAKLTASDGVAYDNNLFGYSVSISGDYAIVAANQDDDSGNNAGSAYMYSGITSVTVGIDDGSSNIPTSFVLGQNHPNPFNPTTTIRYSIPQTGFVSLKIYDLLGREIRTLVKGFQKANTYFVNFDASNLSSGVYFYRLQVGNDFVETKKMLYLR